MDRMPEDGPGGFNRTEHFLLSGVVGIKEQSFMGSHFVTQHRLLNAKTECRDVMLCMTEYHDAIPSRNTLTTGRVVML